MSVSKSVRLGQVGGVSEGGSSPGRGNGDVDHPEYGVGGQPPAERKEVESSVSRSMMALGVEGEVMVRLEGVEDRDLTGKETAVFLILDEEDHAYAHERLRDVQEEVAARVLARLPKRKV